MLVIATDVYQLDAKALKSGFLVQRWTEIVDASGAALTVSATSTPTPADKIRVLLEVNQLASGGGGQTSNGVLFEIHGPAPNYPVMYARNNFYTAAATQSQAFTLNSAIVMPGEYIQMTSTFSAAVAVNTVQMRLIGYEIPRGNVM